MSRARTKLLSGTIALFIGGFAFPMLFLAIVGGLDRVGFKLGSLAWAYAAVVSGWAAFEAFRGTFNFLCERWSNEADPPCIREWRARRNVVRTT
ncbi:MAG: hypothetical protein ACKVXR_17045 [Planctomycetota bacterium]